MELNVPVPLLLGLIAIVLLFSAVRYAAPERTMLAGAVLGAGAITLMLLHLPALATLDFWAGAIGFVAILSALMIVIHPNPMISVLFLIVNLFCIALFYLMLKAQFLAAIQVIVYAGAIMVLFVFVVMLLNLKAEEGLRLVAGPQRAGALLLGALFAGLMFYALRHRADHPYIEAVGPDATFGSARLLAGTMFTRYLFAFETASLLLIAAMVGAVILAKRKLR